MSYHKEYYAKNKEKLRASAKARYEANKEAIKERAQARHNAVKDTPEFKAKKAAYSRKRYAENKEKMRASADAWRAANRGKTNAYTAERRAKKLQATPALTEDELWMITEVYDLCAERTRVTGVIHHVDHVVPLQGTHVSGLHVPWNLQVLTAHDNISKSNSWEVS